MKWEPSDPTRWAVLGLADPPADGAFPDAGLTADLLAYALTAPGAEDPIAGIVDAVRVELLALGDNRVPSPVEPDPEVTQDGTQSREVSRG